MLDEARRQLEASKGGARGPFYAVLCGVGSVMVLYGDVRLVGLRFSWVQSLLVQSRRSLLGSYVK